MAKYVRVEMIELPLEQLSDCAGAPVAHFRVARAVVGRRPRGVCRRRPAGGVGIRVGLCLGPRLRLRPGRGAGADG